MTKVFTFGLFALAAFAATPQTSQAQFFGGGSPFGCGGFCVCNFGKMHQHGPLYNYGPYYGYAPFEPYGPWTSDLRYNPPGCADGKCRGGWNPIRNHLGSHCGNWGHYAHCTLQNIFHRTHPCADKAGCCGCSAAAVKPFSPITTVSATEAAK